MINKAEQSLDKRLINDLMETKRNLKEIKGIQPMGGDIIDTQSAPEVGTVVIDTGILAGTWDSLLYTFSIDPADDNLVNWVPYFSVYFGNDLDPDWEFPDGQFVTGLAFEFDIYSWWDWALSYDSDGTRVFHLRLDHNSGLSDRLIIRVKLYAPKLSTSVTN